MVLGRVGWNGDTVGETEGGSRLNVIGMGGEVLGIEYSFLRFARRVTRHTKLARRAATATTPKMMATMATALIAEGSVVVSGFAAGKTVDV